MWRHNEKTFVGHGGSCPGYRSQLSICPEDKIAVIVMTNAHDVGPGSYTRQIHDAVAPAIKKTLESPDTAKKADPDLRKFVGRYERPLGSEIYVLIMEGELAMVYLPTDNPLQSLTKIKRVKDNIFRRVRDDGNLGEKIVFEIGPDGEVKRLIRHSNYAIRVN